jgi:outer membrane protein
MAIFQGFQGGPAMTEKIARIVILGAFLLPVSAMAQGGSTTTPSTTTPGTSLVLSARIGTINIQSAIVATSDGQKDLQILEKKFDPKQNELKSLNDEIVSLKKQLETQGPKLNDEARANLGRQIDSKQKILSRAQEDAQNDFTEQQNEIVQTILQKLLPVVNKYAKDNGLTLVVDGSKPWPEWPVLWANPSVDITKAVVDIYNAQAGAPPVSQAPRSDSPTRQSHPRITSSKPQASEAPK